MIFLGREKGKKFNAYCIALTMRPNEPIRLYEGELILWAGNESDKGTGKVIFRWLPSPKTTFEMVGTQHSISHVKAVIEDHEVELEIPGGYLQKARMLLSSIDLAGKELPRYQGTIDRYYNKVLIPECDVVEFCLTNFRFAKPLKNNDWIIDIEPVTSDIDSIFETLENENGYAITHRGFLRRVDGSPFTIYQAEEMSYALYQFYSFIKGEWSGPIFCKGKLDGKMTWEQWGNPRITPFRSQKGIAQARQFDQNRAFTGFMNKWADEKWKETLELVIYFYVEANIMSMIEISIILLQAALERLTWAVGNKKKNAEKLRHADERINWLLGEMELPIELPPTMANLWKYADKSASKIQYPKKAKIETKSLEHIFCRIFEMELFILMKNWKELHTQQWRQNGIVRG